MKKTSQKSFKPVFAELKKKHHILSPNNKHTLLVYAFIIFTNIDEKKKCRRERHTVSLRDDLVRQCICFRIQGRQSLSTTEHFYDPEISVKSVCRNAKKYSNGQANKNTVAKCSSVAAQCGSAEREVASSNPGRTNTQGL